MMAERIYITAVSIVLAVAVLTFIASIVLNGPMYAHFYYSVSA